MHGIDYTETFAPSIRWEILEIFLVIAIMLKMILLQIDVIGDYIESSFGQKDQPIYIKISQKCRIEWEGLVYKNLKSLYNIKQAEKLWNKTIIKFFQKIGFVLTNANLCILVYKQDDIFILVRVYIDDFLLRFQSQDGLE